MKNTINQHRPDKTVSVWTLLLCLTGLGINLFLSKLALWLELPLFLDNIGSILVACLGGPLPGVCVGFLSNLINSASNPISLYYGILTILIALLACYFSTKGYFKKPLGCIIAALCFALIGGALGSVMTWMLFGGGIGEGISAPYAIALNNLGLPVFTAQLTADMLIDIPDKLITVLIVALALHFYPKALYDKFQYSFLYDRSEEEILKLRNTDRSFYRTASVIKPIMILVLTSSALIALTSVFTAYYNYSEQILQQYIGTVQNTSQLVATNIDGDRINEYIQHGEYSEEYRETKARLQQVKDGIPNLTYVYVYQVERDGCRVVFDLDSGDVLGDEPGKIIDLDPGFSNNLDVFLDGGEIEPMVTNDSYGWLVTSCTPILDSFGNTVAYACADISMTNYVHDILVYIIKIIATLFGITILITAISLRYARRRISEPINRIVEQSRIFNQTDPELWLESEAWKNRPAIHTGDEIEELYNTICNVEENVSHNVAKLKSTELKLLQSKDVERKNEELSQAIRLADEANVAKTEFYSRMSHDMRTPMNGIIGLAKLSRDETDIEVLQENIEKIARSGEYLLGLINDTLDMSKIESKKLVLNKTPIHLGRFFDNVVDMLATSIDEKQIRLQLINHNMDTDIYVLADELRLKQVFMNLLSNAIKFTRPGGTIMLTMETLNTEGRLIFNRFTVSDTGVGMSPEFVEHHLFQPFSQEHNEITTSYAGTGLGLAIVKKLVLLMNGQIDVESHLNQGTTFTLHLNFEKTAAPNTRTRITEAPSIPLDLLQGQSILLCEDHPLNAEITRKLLDKAGMKVTLAQNGQIALDIFRTAEQHYFAAILMDIRMPVMDGLTATRNIRALDRPDAKTIPIIALTANVYEEDMKMSRNAGMNAHLSKPIDAQRMYRTLAALIRAAK